MGEETEVQHLLDQITDLKHKRQKLFDHLDKVVVLLAENYDSLAKAKSALADIS